MEDAIKPGGVHIDNAALYLVATSRRTSSCARTVFGLGATLSISLLLQSCKTVPVVKTEPKTYQDIVTVTESLGCAMSSDNALVNQDNNKPRSCSREKNGETLGGGTFYSFTSDESDKSYENGLTELEAATIACLNVSLSEEQFQEDLTKGKFKIVSSRDWREKVPYWRNDYTADKMFKERHFFWGSLQAVCSGVQYTVEVSDGFETKVVGSETVPFWHPSQKKLN